MNERTLTVLPLTPSSVPLAPSVLWSFLLDVPQGPQPQWSHHLPHQHQPLLVPSLVCLFTHSQHHNPPSPIQHLTNSSSFVNEEAEAQKANASAQGPTASTCPRPGPCSLNRLASLLSLTSHSPPGSVFFSLTSLHTFGAFASWFRLTDCPLPGRVIFPTPLHSY